MDFSLILIIVVSIVFILVLAQEWRSLRSRHELWGELVAHTGLVQVGIGWHSEKYRGQYRGRPLILQIQASRHETKTIFVVVIKNLAHRTFTLAEDALYRQGESYGASIFQSGDEAFDRRFTFKTHSQEFAHALLSLTELQQKLLQMPFVDVELVGQELRCTVPGDITTSDTEQVIFTLDVLNDLARNVEAFQPRPETKHAPHTIP